MIVYIHALTEIELYNFEGKPYYATRETKCFSSSVIIIW